METLICYFCSSQSSPLLSFVVGLDKQTVMDSLGTVERPGADYR